MRMENGIVTTFRRMKQIGIRKQFIKQVLFLFLGVLGWMNPVLAQKNKNDKLFELVDQVKDSDIDSTMKLIEIIKQANPSKNEYYHRALYIEARTLSIKGDFEQALPMLKTVEGFYLKEMNHEKLAKIYIFMSFIHKGFKDKKKEEDYLLKSLYHAKKIDDKLGESIAYANLIGCYFDGKQYDKAWKSLNEYERLKDVNPAAEVFIQLFRGNICLINKEYDKAMMYGQKSYELAKKFNDFHIEMSSLILLGECHLRFKEYDQAIRCLNEGLKIADKFSNDPDKANIYSVLIKVYEGKKDYRQAFLYQQKFYELKNRISSEETHKYINELEARIDLKGKEKVILKQKNKLLKGELKQKQADEKLKFYGLFLLSLVIVLVIVGFFYFKLRANNRLISSQKQELTKLNLLNQKIFAIISHDLKGPFNSLQIMMNLLDKRDHEFAAELIPDIKTELKQANLILENLLNYAKAELNFTSTKELFSVRELVAEIESHFQVELQKKKLHIDNQIQENFQLESSKDIYKIIVRNLLSNAIKYSPENKVISIYNDHEQNVYVKDEGAGVPEEIKEKLFRENIRSQRGTAMESGFGLGLKMSAELAGKINFTLDLISNPGQGSIFVIKS